MNLDALGRLQLEALRALMRRRVRDEDHYVSILEEAVQMARERGFKPLGIGSTRFAVELEDGTVAKLAYRFPGLLLNLQEAVFTLVFPRELTRHLTPCLALAPSLVLVQERVAAIGASLPESWGRDDKWFEQEHDRFGEQIAELRQVFSPTELEEDDASERLDNYGVRRGKLVSIDYGQKWYPLGAAVELVLERLKDGPLELDKTAAEWLCEETLEALEGTEEDDWLWHSGPDGMTFMRRAGLRPHRTDPCPCGSTTASVFGIRFGLPRTYGECYRVGREGCLMARDAFDYLRSVAIHEWPPIEPPAECLRRQVKLARRRRRETPTTGRQNGSQDGSLASIGRRV